MPNGNGKKAIIRIGGYGNTADQDRVSRSLKEPLQRMLGDIELVWEGNGKRRITCDSVPPEQMREFSRIVQEELGRGFTVTLSCTL